MGKQIAYEVTQPVVRGNEVLHAAGDLFGSEADVPGYVQAHAVIVDVPDEPGPAPEAKAAAGTARGKASLWPLPRTCIPRP